MRIINIVDRLDAVNFGIWNAALSTAYALRRDYSVESELWYPRTQYKLANKAQKTVRCRPLDDCTKAGCHRLLGEAGMDWRQDIIITHGCWQYPTRWGRYLKDLGFTWLAVPHGMLEPWSLNHKRWRKSLYFRFVERRHLSSADACRGVAVTEAVNLEKLLRRRTVHIPNSVEWQPLAADKNCDKVRHFLFLGRLNKKKGIMELLKAWEQSEVWHSGRSVLTIAGPDDGEGALLRKWLEKSRASESVRLAPAAYGTEKDKMFRRSHFFVLPSFSEGFPTSILEALNMGLVPLVSDNCNFPELWENGLGLLANPVVENIVEALKTATDLPCASFQEQIKRGSEFVRRNYSNESVAKQQFDLCEQLMLASRKDGD